MIAPRAAGATPIVGALALTHAEVSPKTTWSFVRVECTDGSIGVGEATLMRDAHTLDAPFRAVQALLQRSSLAHVREVVEHAERDSLARAAVASALEQALWDIEARRAGLPAWALAGGTASAIPLYANINRRTVDRSPAGFLASAREAAAAGFGALKVAPFDALTPANAPFAEGRENVDRGLARVAAVREAIGASRELYVDCHWRFTLATARKAIDALAEFGVVWFECPLPENDETRSNIVGLRAHANARGMCLAGLEELTSREAFRPWLEAGAYDVVMPDVKYCGGIAALVAIGADARRVSTRCIPHNPSGPVSHAASLAACSVLARPVLLEHQWDETPWFFRIGGPKLPLPQDGVSPLPSASGLGVTLDFEGLDIRSP